MCKKNTIDASAPRYSLLLRSEPAQLFKYVLNLYDKHSTHLVCSISVSLFLSLKVINTKKPNGVLQSKWPSLERAPCHHVV